MKKVWQKPELVVLVRGKPEEAVLTACKGGTFSGSPQVGNGQCTRTNCTSCTVIAPS